MDHAGPPAITLRPATPADRAWVARVYLAAMRDTLDGIGLSPAQQAGLLDAQWDAAEVRIIVAAGREVGWIQLAPAEGAVFVRTICVDAPYQGLGIGGTVLRMVMADAARERCAVTLGVVKGSRAHRLYQRLGFVQTHDDAWHVYLRRDPG
jgi:GNAT superfamily N-acetyltransferase